MTRVDPHGFALPFLLVGDMARPDLGRAREPTLTVRGGLDGA